jgi:orotidine-5'-phosphate decarboxylase
MSLPKSIVSNPLIVALDVDSENEALALAQDLGDIAGCFKLGPRLIYRYGASLVQKIARETPVFVDCKYFDIPSTMVSAVRASFEAGATLVTVHAMAGKEALAELAKLESELNTQRPFQILAVTVLTSFSQEGLPSVLRDQPIASHVLDLATLVKESGLSGVVSSPEELEILKDLDLAMVTPGIRFSEEDKGDQKRVLNPAQAIAAGASAVVVGRPIIANPNPRKAALDYSVALADALSRQKVKTIIRKTT